MACSGSRYGVPAVMPTWAMYSRMVRHLVGCVIVLIRFAWTLKKRNMVYSNRHPKPEYFTRTLHLIHKIMISIIIIRILEKYTLYQRTLCSFWKNLSGHFSRSPLKRSSNRSYGYASTGDRKNWLAEISPEFCILMKHSG